MAYWGWRQSSFRGRHDLLFPLSFSFSYDDYLQIHSPHYDKGVPPFFAMLMFCFIGAFIISKQFFFSSSFTGLFPSWSLNRQSGEWLIFADVTLIPLFPLGFIYFFLCFPFFSSASILSSRMVGA